ncbi:MAG: RDD family protein [Halioglobus sp.]|nr:RDD family protein [Halioglobus sp.]
MTETAPTSSPSLLRRLAAMLYDTFLVVALVAVVNAIALAVVVRATGGEQEVLSAPVVQLLTVTSVFGFFCLFWLKNGQTLGMQAWRIKLVDYNGNPPTAGRAIVRCCGALLSAACLGLGYLWCLVDRNHRYWHDYLSRTELILLPKTPGKKPG